jgi:VWFA-related protein
MRRTRLAALAAVLVAGTAGVLVRASASIAPAQQPTFRSGADVVQVDVVVQDRSGQFVGDLAEGDFELREDGRLQAIELFYTVGPGRATSSTLAGAMAGPGMAASGRPLPHTFVVVFDDEHLSPGGFRRVQAAAGTLFAAYFHAGDIGGVVADGKMVNGRLTTDREELLAAVRAAHPNARTRSRVFDERQWPRLTELEAIRIQVNGDRTVLDEVVRRACADDPTMCGHGRDPVPEIQAKAGTLATTVQAATNATLQRIAAVLNGLTRIDGPKTVLLLSEGFVAEEAWPGVEQNVALAARANARIYTLDARGLDRGQTDRLQSADPGVNDAGSRLLAQLDFGSDSGNSLATDTGGFVVRNANVFGQAVARIAADAEHYYVLGYRPDRAPDSKYRRITVIVKRPGTIVRARHGYVATPHVATDAAAAARQPEPEPALSPSARPAVNTTGPKNEEPVSSATGAPGTPATGTIVAASGPAASALRLRPDSLKHTEDLVDGVAPSDAAAAGWTAYQRGDLETARTELSAAAASRDARPWVHYALGQSQYALGDFRGAIGSWERVRSASPDFEPVYFDLVDGYLQTREYDKAIRLLRAAADRWPGDHEVFSALGVVQVARSALDDAVQSFQRAIALAPSDAIGYFNLAKTLELRYHKSRRYVRQIGAWMSNDADKENAIANYRRYLAIGGPLENSAREGLARLGWK